jgi:hypothetical protein
MGGILNSLYSKIVSKLSSSVDDGKMAGSVSSLPLASLGRTRLVERKKDPF